MRLFCSRSPWRFALLAASSSLALFLGTLSEAFSQTAFEPGTFQGLLRSGSYNDESFGFITVTLTRSGTFTMRFNLGVNQLGRHSYVKAGRFDENGAYNFEGPEPLREPNYAIPRFISLQLEPSHAPAKISGNVTDGTHSSTIELERVAVYSSIHPAPQTGRYTFLFSNPDDPMVPASTGFGTLIVSRGGRLSASGRSADGRPFSQSAAVTVSGRWPVFAKLGGTTKGILSGWLGFEETADGDFSGQLIWLGPEVPGPNHAFVPEFSGEVSVTGSRYVAPIRSRVLQTIDSTNNVHWSLVGGGLETAIERDLTLTAANRIIFAPRVPGDSLSISLGTGLFTGTFLHSDNRITVFRGVIHQKQNLGAGHFVDRAGESGNVLLIPLEP